MENTYLFFDVECANCFDGVGKMCSFGYVLVDGEFNVLDSDDVVMNPEAEFDWYLFSNKRKCSLAYSKDYFRSKPNFESFYKPIKKLMETSGRRVIGFSVANDVGFVINACERYNLFQINFAAYDIASIVNQANNTKKGLVDWCDFYKIDLSQFTVHKSQDDAMMTMLLTKEFCKSSNIKIDALLEKNKGCRISVEKFIEQRDLKKYNDEIMKKIEDIQGKKSRAVLTNRLHGDYAIGFKLKNDIDFSLKIVELIYKHGGIFKFRIKSSGTLIIDDTFNKNLIPDLERRNIKTLFIDEFLDLVKME